MDKPVGEIRKLESLNRIVLPSEVRNIKNLKPLEYAEIYVKENKDIVIEKYNPEKSKSAGLVRRLDALGRIVIPKPTVKELDLKEGDLIQFVSGEKGEIILRKYYQTCVFCGGKKELYKFSDKLICEDCLRELMELVVKK